MFLLTQHPDEEKESSEEEEEEEDDEDDESDDEETPLIKFQKKKKQNQFVKALMAFWPFGETFRELSIFNKIIEIIKVRNFFTKIRWTATVLLL